MSGPARRKTSESHVSEALRRLALDDVSADLDPGWPVSPAALRIGVSAKDVATLKEADKAHRKIVQGQRFNHTRRSERSRRLMWTVLVDRYQLRPDLVDELLDGARPSKEYVRLLEAWVARPENRDQDVTPVHRTVNWPAGAYDWYAIVGATGVGKSATGMALSQRLGRQYVNVDDEVERRHGQPLYKLFADYGSLRTLHLYRDAVTEWLSETEADARLVVSFGAGSVLLPEMMSLVSRCRASVWLTATPRTIVNRLASDVFHAAHVFGSLEYLPLFQCTQIGRAPVYAKASRWVSAEAPIIDVVDELSSQETILT